MYVWYKFQLSYLFFTYTTLFRSHKILGVFALFSATAHRREMGVPPLDRASKVTYGAYHLEPLKWGNVGEKFGNDVKSALLKCSNVKKFAKLWINIVAKGNILGWILYFCNRHWWTRYVLFLFQLCQSSDIYPLSLHDALPIWVFALFSATAHRREMGVPPLDRASKVTYGAYHLEPLRSEELRVGNECIEQYSLLK